MSEGKYQDILCALSKNYARSTGVGCFYWMQDRQDDCVGCPDCRCDLLCYYCHASAKYAEMCERQSLYAGNIARELCQPYIYACPLDLVRWAVPVIAGREHLGTLYGGCVRISKKLNKEDIRPLHFDFFHLPWETFSQAWHEIPYRTPQQVHYASEQLFYNMCYIMETKQSVISERHKREREQTALYEEISQEKSKQAKNLSISRGGKKKDSADQNNSRLEMSLQEEKELISRIQMGDHTAVKNILNRMFGKIFSSNYQNIPMVKTQLLELVIAVGRDAMPRKTENAQRFDFYRDIIEELDSAENMSQIDQWAKSVFARLVNLIYESRMEQKSSVVEQITLHIKQNYEKDLTLESISQAVGYSSYYIGRLFKEELDMSIIDYLTEVRIARAKELLEQTDDLVAVIAEKVGYQYSHYFARIFKKQVGISPSEYRRLWLENRGNGNG